MGFVKAFEFSHSKIIARNLNRPKYVLMKTKEKINRTFSYRRSTAHLPSSVSMENLNSSILSRTPSASKRISRVFNFLTPKENHDPHFHLNARKLGSINVIRDTCVVWYFIKMLSYFRTWVPQKKLTETLVFQLHLLQGRKSFKSQILNAFII